MKPIKRARVCGPHEATDLELEEIPGLQKSTITKLRRAGVETVEDLALIDVDEHNLKNANRAQVVEWRRKAQAAIFRGALRRLQHATDQAFEALEGVIMEATWTTVDAAKVAQERASDALDGARRQTRAFAKLASDRAREAAVAAQAEYEKLRTKVDKAPHQYRKQLKRYEKRAKSAADAAERAAKNAAQAFRLANEKWKAESKQAQLRGGTFVRRLRERVSTSGNGHGRR